MSWSWDQSRPTLAALLACYAAYVLAAGFGQWMIVTPGIPIIVWPPNGVILAVLLANERRQWVWWIAVALMGEATANWLWFQKCDLACLGPYGCQ